MSSQLDAPVASQRRGVPGRTASTSTAAEVTAALVALGWHSRLLDSDA